MKVIKNETATISPENIGDYQDIDAPAMNARTLEVIIEHVALRLTLLAARSHRENGGYMVSIKLSDITHELNTVAEEAAKAITELSRELNGASIDTQDILKRMEKNSRSKAKNGGKDK